MSGPDPVVRWPRHLRTPGRFARRRGRLLAIGLVTSVVATVAPMTAASATPTAAAQTSCPPQPKSTKVMQPSRVTASELAGWYASTGKTNKATVSMPTLADYFIREGDAERVAGDWAFAQSIVETGYFEFGGIVPPSANNFSGLGATGGDVAGAAFPSAEIGVRAQIQHLRAYADPTVTAAKLRHPLVDPRFNLISPKGKAPYWEQFGNGIWAAAPCYYDTVASVRARIRAWALAHRRWTPFLSVQSLVTAAFREQVLREPTANEVVFYSTALQQGSLTPVGLLATLASREALHTGSVARVYLAVLHRAPSLTYLRQRVAQHRSGVRIETMANDLLASAEFRKSHSSITNPALVSLVYRNVLGRSPNNVELFTWASDLARGKVSRGAFVRAVSESAEAKRTNKAWTEATVAYLPMVLRLPPSADVSWWRSQRAGGASLQVLMQRLYRSASYTQRWA